MKVFKTPNYEAGFTIMEMLICICMISISLVGVSKMQIGAMNGNQKSTRMILANLESCSAADLILGKDFNSADLTAAETEYTLPSLSGFAITYKVTDIKPYNSADAYHSILLTTSWSDNAGPHSIQRTLTMLP